MDFHLLLHQSEIFYVRRTLSLLQKMGRFSVLTGVNVPYPRELLNRVHFIEQEAREGNLLIKVVERKNLVKFFANKKR